MPEEGMLVLSYPIDEVAFCIPESKIVPCAECGTSIFMSPASQKLLEAGAAPYCVPCGVSKFDLDPGGPVLSDAQKQLIEKVLGHPISEESLSKVTEAIREDLRSYRGRKRG